MVSITVLGEPVAQGRPRFTTVNDRPRAYDPSKSKDYKTLVRLEASLQAPKQPLEGPIMLEVQIYRTIPKSFSKIKTAAAEAMKIRPTTKPDTDNYLKGIKDALKGIIWRDDSQVVEIKASKYYSVRPRIEVAVKELQ